VPHKSCAAALTSPADRQKEKDCRADDHLTYDGCGGCAEGELEEPEGVVLEADEEEVF